MKTVVVVPMKDAAESKTRLAAVMSAAQRERMAIALFHRAQEFFTAQYPRFDRLVVTSSPRIAALAHARGCRVLMEVGPPGLNAAVSSAFEWARGAGFDKLLVVPADIPVWLRAEVDDLLDEGRLHPVAIARAHDGGTNALLIDLAQAARFEFRYGRDSARRHADFASAAGLGVALRTWPFLSRDIDTADDCLVFSQKLAALTGAR